MGNNTSNVRKSSVENNFRKSTTSQNNQQNLDEEFSDLILHEVRKKQEESNVKKLNNNQFSNDLIEDEFNELNDLIETDTSELSRNIINDDDMDVEINDDMEIDELNDVDFTKVLNQSEGQVPPMDQSQSQSPYETMPQKIPKHQPIQQMGTLPNRRPNGGISSPSNFAYHLNTNSNNSSQQDIKLVNVEIKWVNITKEDIQKISIIGSFSNWRNIIRLKQSTTHNNEYNVTIKLPLGVHKLLYIINNEYRVSEQLPTATDQEGIFFNWFEVIDDLHLFNHSQNQPNRENASTKYDANIIQSAGQFEINEIKKKSNSFLARISKEEPNFEHVEFMESSPEREDSTQNQHQQQGQQHQPPQQQQQQQQQHHQRHLDHDFHPPTSPGDFPMENKDNGSFSDKYIMMSDNNSSSFLVNEQAAKLEYSSEIPEIFVNYNFFKSKNENFELPEPPQLPAHLNNVLLNKISNNSTSNLPAQTNPNLSLPQLDSFKQFEASTSGSASGSVGSGSGGSGPRRPPLRRADSSYYASNRESYHQSIPNHVILNHLMTTSIRNDVLTVACITRYSGKFVTQIMHSPADV
ncbi:hypothetical protein CLIB1444_11S01684 [[Candida] jaroonii]|uniref:Uncharacterized protein n=1 Tax=[Candida] jaroonii TaxID=467808 RepID=A0ACA9YCK9_9ASCO|nr:hypothetical protein CLIB1444_11S01684 [[Candida] jaroonii]